MRVASSTLTTPSVGTVGITVIRGVLATKQVPHDSGSLVRKIKPIPIEFRRPSIVRASGHTFEYLGYGPGNYSTALPQVQSITLTEREEFLVQSQERSGGVVVYTGMNNNGDSFIGNRKTSSSTGEEITFDNPIPTVTGEDPSRLSVIFDEVTVKERLVVEGGNSGTVLSQFDGPVTFNKEIRFNDSVNIKSQLKVSDATQSTTTANGAIVVSGGVGIAKNLNVGGNIFGNVIGSVTGPTFSGDAVNKANIKTRTESGFYEHDTATTGKGWPITSNTWMHMIACTHSDNANYYSMQIAASFFNNTELYYRSTNASGTTAWAKIWNSANDGVGSGLDADLLDGINSTSFARVDSSSTFTQRQFFYAPVGSETFGVWSSAIEIREVGVVGNTNTSNKYAPGINFHWGNIAATAIKMYNDGSIRFKSNNTTETSYRDIYALNVNTTSDIRVKTNIKNISNPIEKLSKINGVSFDWKNTEKSSLGLIAQEVEKVFPEIVNTDEEENFKTLNYNGMIGVLVEAIKEQQTQINNLTDQIEELKKKFN